eukprot:gene18202-23864_t
MLNVMRNDEKEHTYCSFGETYLKYRKVVIEWMIDVCEYFSLDPTTIHAAVAYLDRLQPNDRYTRYEWQMLAISCILLSAKYNECEENVPDRVTLEDITQQPISNATILNYEVFALKNLSWKLNARTAMSFLSCYMTLGLLDGTEICPEFLYLEDRKIIHLYTKGFRKTIYMQIVQIMFGIQLSSASIKVSWTKIFPEEIQDDEDNDENLQQQTNNNTNNITIGENIPVPIAYHDSEKTLEVASEQAVNGQIY